MYVRILALFKPFFRASTSEAKRAHEPVNAAKVFLLTAFTSTNHLSIVCKRDVVSSLSHAFIVTHQSCNRWRRRLHALQSEYSLIFRLLMVCVRVDRWVLEKRRLDAHHPCKPSSFFMTILLWRSIILPNVMAF